MRVNMSNLLIPGEQLGDKPSVCYIGIFRSLEPSNTYHIGAVALEDYYVVYD